MLWQNAAYKFPNTRSNPESQSKLYSKTWLVKDSSYQKSGEENQALFQSKEDSSSVLFSIPDQKRNAISFIFIYLCGVNLMELIVIRGISYWDAYKQFYIPLSDVQEKTQPSFIWTPFYAHIKADEFNFMLLLRWETMELAPNGSVPFHDLFSATINLIIISLFK